MGEVVFYIITATFGSNLKYCVAKGFKTSCSYNLSAIRILAKHYTTIQGAKRAIKRLNLTDSGTRIERVTIKPCTNTNVENQIIVEPI